MNTLIARNLYELLQSELRWICQPQYKETAPAQVSNDILRAMDNCPCVCMVLLGLSTAFDTTDHMLLSYLEEGYGIMVDVADWMQSYLTGHYQSADLNQISSEILRLDCSFPRG